MGRLVEEHDGPAALRGRHRLEHDAEAQRLQAEGERAVTELPAKDFLRLRQYLLPT
jgi:hypothetical protein